MTIDTADQLKAALADRYVLTRELGAGGMAVVYLAHDIKLDRDVALKVLRPELGAVLGGDRFLTEIKISARLDHPHILTLIDSGDAGGFLYYVLPYVRGESLRDKLNRERQLGLEEALSITRQVASALDYAHRQGLVHRDIKPENILLQEGEAMLADFGIALAVKEAGGNRLTQTGLSLGTPQYMSPEQATGDRGIDARSDVYSLASVLYEMLAGEPPVTGANAQSMIAKLMTEKPTSLRVLRDTTPLGIDKAVAQALAKSPADRFATAGDFVRALEVKVAEPKAQGSSRGKLIAAGVGLVAVLGAVGAWALKGGGKPADHGAILGLKTQLTSTGAVYGPAISPDGKQLAFQTRTCTSTCTYSIVVQDVGGSTTRTILEGATSGGDLSWSPDRRNLLYSTVINGRAGTYLISALGGTPRWLTNSGAAFYAGGDSLVVAPMYRPDSVFWVHVTGLDGTIADSIRVVGPGTGMATLSVVPGTQWIVSLIVQEPHGLWQVMDRSGKVVDHVVNQCTCGGTATRDAVWLSRLGNGTGESIVRIALDRATGHLAARQDTMATGYFTGFSLTDDGASMVMDEGTYDHSVWVLPTADLLKAKFPESARVVHTSANVAVRLSPDGSRLLVNRAVPIGANRIEPRFSVLPIGGGPEVPVAISGVPIYASWLDSVTVGTVATTPTGVHMVEVNVQTRAQGNAFDLPDSTVRGAVPIPGGWAWIPASRDKVVLRQGGKTREVKVLPWFAGLQRIITDPAHDRVLLGGYDRSTGDSIGVATASLSDGTMTLWSTWFAGGGNITPQADGSLFVYTNEPKNVLGLYRLTGPGQRQSLGDAPRPLTTAAASADLSRIAVVEEDYRADAWMYKVVPQ